MRPASPALQAVALLTLLFLVVPIVIVIPMSFSSASSLTFPPTDLSLRWYRAFFESESWTEAMVNSIVVAFMSSTLALVLGSLAAYGLRRRPIALRGVIEANFMAPMVLPTIISAVALYVTLSRVGLLGSFLGLVLAHTVLVVPYVVVVMGVAIHSFDVRLEQVSWTMGASWPRTVSTVVAPLLAPNLAAAWILAFVGSFDEVVVTSFIAGAYDTIPKHMFGELLLEVSPTITAVASLLIGFTALCLLAAGLVIDRSARLPAP